MVVAILSQMYHFRTTKVACTTILPPPIVYEAVDLGLPSGTKWASQNVGARKPSDAGLYFAWGETQGYSAGQVGKGEGKKNFYWNDYKWNPSGDGETFTKYTTIGAALELEDDAAHVNMGGDWHMPSPTQIQELLDNTTITWKTLYGVNGRKFTSRKDKSKFIFIPAAGYAWDGSVQDSGGDGGVWFSVLYTDGVYGGQSLSFGSGDVGLDGYDRCVGLSIRGVIDKKLDKPKDKKKNRETKEGRSIEGIINRMKNDLNIKIKKEDAGYVVVELYYKDECIDSDWCVG